MDSNSTTGAAAPVEDHLVDAEDCLQQGMVEDASRLARKVLQQPAGPTTAEKARALNVLIQADFHFENRLTDLEQLLEDSGLALEQLPVTAVLLWGVVAVELEAADEARALLRRYLDTKNFGEGSDVTREDALALSRLYAVQLLSGLCGDFQAAADWLTDGGAGLSEEQQELLLLEVDEAEELAQEEHVAEWTSQDAAQVAHLGTHAHLHHGAGSGSAAAAAGAYSDVAHECGATDSASAVGSIASTALHELGPSVSGVLSLHPADSSMSNEHDFDSAMSHERAASGAADAAPSRSSAGSDGSSSNSGSAAAKASPASAAAAAGAQLEAAAAAVAAAEARLAAVSSPLSSPAATAPAASGPPAVAVAVAVRGLEDSERVPSSPSLASWRRSPDEVAVQDQEGHRGGANSVNSSSSNAFVTITGAFNDQGYDPEVVAALAAEAAAAAAAAGSGSGSGSRRGPSSPQKGGKAQVARAGTTSSSDLRSRLRSAASDVAAAAAAAVATAVANGQAAVAAVTGSEAAAPAESASQEQQQQEQQQEEEGEAGAAEGTQEGQGQQSWVQSYASWASDKAFETWQSQPVQDAIKALNLQDVPAWELASGAAAAVLLTYGLYRNRRRVRRAAADFAAGVSQTARMALGVSVNPMAAVPGIGHR